MFNWKFLKKVKIKGVSMVEYAVLLAFLVVVAVVFMDDGGLEKGILGSVNKILAVLDNKAVKKNTLSSITFASKKGWRVQENDDGSLGLIYKDVKEPYCASGFLDLDGPGHYIIQFDYDKFAEALYATGNYKTMEEVEAKVREYKTDHIAKYGVGLFLVNGVGHSIDSDNLTLVSNDDFDGFHRMSVDPAKYDSKLAIAESTKLNANADSGIIHFAGIDSKRTTWYNGIEFTSNGNNSLCFNMENSADIPGMETAVRNALVITKQ